MNKRTQHPVRALIDEVGKLLRQHIVAGPGLERVAMDANMWLEEYEAKKWEDKASMAKSHSKSIEVSQEFTITTKLDEGNIGDALISIGAVLADYPDVVVKEVQAFNHQGSDQLRMYCELRTCVDVREILERIG